jgi:predicted aldo/keto reductase-like oxidoreductase
MSEVTDKRISRREFVYRSGAAAGGAILATGAVQAAAPAAARRDAIPKRVLGKTGVEVSTMTLGTAPCGFVKPANPGLVAQCVNTAIDLGITAIDTAPAYDVAEEGVGLALGRRRRQVFLSTKVLADDVPAAEKIFAHSLKVLKTDYVDLLYFHQTGDRNVAICRNPDGVFTWLVKQKKAGHVRFVGISIHNRPKKCIELLESGEVDVLLTIVNLVDRHTYRFEENVLPVARKHNVGIVAMKAFGGAKGGNYADPNCPPMLDVEHLELAVRYSLGTPGVATLDIGCHNVGQIRRNIAMVRSAKPLTGQEAAKADALGRKLAAQWKDHLGPIAGIPLHGDALA